MKDLFPIMPGFYCKNIYHNWILMRCTHAVSCRKLELLNYSGNNLFLLMFDILDAFC